MKVLLIENQKTQFDSIKKLLTDNDIEVLPDEQDYKNLISNIKVILQGWKFYRGQGGQYPENRKEFALTNFNDFIIIQKPDVIFIDYRLSGSEDSGNGLDLAKLIRDMVNTPIIFLSRHSLNNSDIDREYKRYNIFYSFWVEKGYAGQALNEQEYFKKNVINKIHSYFCNNLFDEHSKKFKDSLLTNALNMISNNAWIKNKCEDDRTKSLTQFLEIDLKEMKIKFQHFYGESSGGKKDAEIDIFASFNGRELCIVEALNMERYEWTDLIEHISKALIDYNPLGCKIRFILVYYNGNQFEKFKKSYVNKISDPNLYSNLKQTFKLLKTEPIIHNEYNSVIEYEQDLFRESMYYKLHHIVLNFNYKNK